jgi:hypothetical protein
MFFAERARKPSELRDVVLDIAFGLAEASTPAEPGAAANG